jgi:hypothetical protein
MSKWIRNLRSVLDDRPVVLLHGNVRDRYIDEEGSVFENLTKLLEDIARQLPISFSRLVFYDPAGRERVIDLSEPSDPKVAEKLLTNLQTASLRSPLANKNHRPEL